MRRGLWSAQQACGCDRTSGRVRACVSVRVCLRYLYPAQRVPVFAFEREGPGNTRPCRCLPSRFFLCLSLYAYEQGLYATSVMSCVETLPDAPAKARHMRACIRGVDLKTLPKIFSRVGGKGKGQEAPCSARPRILVLLRENTTVVRYLARRKHGGVILRQVAVPRRVVDSHQQRCYV